jgi:hypothetical protein
MPLHLRYHQYQFQFCQLSCPIFVSTSKDVTKILTANADSHLQKYYKKKKLGRDNIRQCQTYHYHHRNAVQTSQGPKVLNLANHKLENYTITPVLHGHSYFLPHNPHYHRTSTTRETYSHNKSICTPLSVTRMQNNHDHSLSHSAPGQAILILPILVNR